MSKVITAGSLTPSTVDTPLDARARVSTFSEIANIELPARFMTIVTEDTGRFYQVMKLCPKVIGGIEVENAAIDITDPDALLDLTAIEEARAAAEAERERLAAEMRELYEEVKVFDDRKADIDGQYDKLTSGNAYNLIGRGEATEEEFTFRPSGDMSIQDGTARIIKLKGNTVVWNQLFKEVSYFNIQFDNNLITKTKENGSYIIEFDDFTPVQGVDSYNYTLYDPAANGFINILSGHKYLILADVDGKYIQFTRSALYDGTSYFVPFVGDTPNVARFFTAGNSTGVTIARFDVYVGKENYGKANTIKVTPRIIDLTKMFGEGNEPATVEEFESLYADVPSEYNEGEIKSLTATGIKSVGFNAWDEEWTQGVYDTSTGAAGSDTVHIRNINPIKVLSNTQYYCESPTYVFAFYYDSDMKFLSVERISESFVTPDGASYMNFYAYYYYQLFGKYQNDICINLSHTGYRNGEYKPYVDFTRQLPIQEIKDSEGNLLFPDGLCSAGTAYDEITEKKAIKRIGKVDLGTLTWRYQFPEDASNYTFYAQFGTFDYGFTVGNILCKKYKTTRWDWVYYGYEDKTIGITKTLMRICDLDYTDAASFKASLSGVYLYYELVTPIEVDLEQEVNMDYEVWDFGTEEMISEGFSTPIKADIIYGFNAVDRIRENTINIEDLITRVARLEAQITSIQTANIVES